MPKKREKKPRHSGTLFLEEIPRDTKAAFKAACARRETTMREAVIVFMREFVMRDIH